MAPKSCTTRRVRSSSYARSIITYFGCFRPLCWSSRRPSGASCRCPADSEKLHARRSSNASKCTLVVSPPRERPILCGPFFLDYPSHPHVPSPRCCPASSPSRCPRRPDPDRANARTPPPTPHAPPSVSSARTPCSNAHNTQAGCARGKPWFQNVQNTVEYPPMTPSNIAPGPREQVLYLVKLLFRKLHDDLLSNDPDHNYTTR